MVLAHNEERHIAACLDSIYDAEPGRAFDVFVMANGCTDRTEEIVSEYGKRRSGVHLVSIKLGDKCNAWNVFIHDTVPTQTPGREIYFFMDGDARVVPGSFSAMARALEADPRAHAASAVPMSGRSGEADRQELLEKRGLVANLYSLRGNFVERLRELGVRIPLNLEGDDGLIGALIKWDLDPKNNQFDDSRIVPCADAGFKFESMSPMKLADWRGYWKRAVRYGRRRFEFQLLGRNLKARGLAGLPRDITEIYSESGDLHVAWNGLYTIPSWFALRDIRRHRR